MELKDVQAIDTMCRVFYCEPEIVKPHFDFYEFRTMAYGTFGGVMKKLGIAPGEEWKVVASLYKPSFEAMLAEMDEIGVEKVFMDATKMWSFRHKALMADYSLELVADRVRQGKGRVVGGLSYNPFEIKKSLEDIEKGVKEYGFKYVWFHPISFGLAPNDKKCYPLYGKCLELGIPVTFQVGHSAEPLPSEVGHPMYADEVAIDFPDLKMVLTHTGWPWVEEWISMLWRHPNVYGNIGAYFPKDLSPALVEFMGGRGQNKVLWATNGFGLTRCKKELVELPISDGAKRKVLRDNAANLFNL